MFGYLWLVMAGTNLGIKKVYIDNSSVLGSSDTSTPAVNTIDWVKEGDWDRSGLYSGTGKRSGRSLAEKRKPFHFWTDERSGILARKRSGNPSVAGKTAPFSSWAGKRSGANGSWAGKRAPFSSWAGKRSGNRFWAGKRAPFSSLAGKISGGEPLYHQME